MGEGQVSNGDFSTLNSTAYVVMIKFRGIIELEVNTQLWILKHLELQNIVNGMYERLTPIT